MRSILESTIDTEKTHLLSNKSKYSDFYSAISPYKPSTDKDAIKKEEIDKKLRKKFGQMDVSMLGFEVFARSRPDLNPNPDFDSINALIFNLSNEKVKYSDEFAIKKSKKVKWEYASLFIRIMVLFGVCRQSVLIILIFVSDGFI